MDGNDKKVINRDYSLDLLRAISVVLLVAYHSFAIYTDHWSSPDGMKEIGAYRYIGSLLSRMSFQPFTFLAGYIFMMQIQRNRWDCRGLILTKVKRLLIPSVFFSVFYILLFKDLFVNPISDFLNGAGHMWYLPMLFCSFIVGFFILRLSDIWMVVSLVAFIIADIVIGDGFDTRYGLHAIRAMVYCMPYFIAGALCLKHKKFIYDILKLPIHTSDGRRFDLRATIQRGLLMVFIILILLMILMFAISYGNSFIANASCFVFSIVLCFLLWMVASYIPVSNNAIVTEIAAASMGIYLFHQFLLKYIIYRTSLPQTIGWWLTPFVCFVVAFAVSMFLTRACRKIPYLKGML